MADEDPRLETLVEQLCVDLNQAHNEILRLQGIQPQDYFKHDWPEWSGPANNIRWAEKILGKKLAKTDTWSLHPTSELWKNNK